MNLARYRKCIVAAAAGFAVPVTIELLRIHAGIDLSAYEPDIIAAVSGIVVWAIPNAEAS